MPRSRSYPAGAPAWVDLVTSDPEDARRFYGELLEWTFDVGGPETGFYTYCRRGGHNAAGMVGRAVETMPTGWTTYLATDSADATAERMQAAGGELVLPPTDAGPAGRVVITLDVTGAMVGAWEAGEHHGAEVVGEPGAVAWSELLTTDVDSAVRFYGEVFGWSCDEPASSADGPPSVTCSVAGRPVGGLTKAVADDRARWIPYFGVADVDAASATAQRLRGRVEAAPYDSLHGPVAQMVDPQGGVFGLIQQAHGSASH